MNFEQAVRLGARLHGVKVSAAAASTIAGVAEVVLQPVAERVLSATAEDLRRLMYEALQAGRHPSWFEDEISKQHWGNNLRHHLATYFEWGVRPFRPDPPLVVIQGGAR